MVEFNQRTKAPTTDNRYYYADNPFYQSGYGLPNCTCYAFGRFWELTGGAMPTLSWGNAEEWYGKNDGYSRGQSPKLGAVICWRKGVAGNNSDGAGHVAIVEQVNADGSIVTSNSAYNSTLFYRQTLTKESGYTWNNNYIFQGFIYNPVDFEGTGGTVNNNTNSGYIWNYFMEKIGNPYGVAGLMGNLDAESGLHPDRVQGDIPYSEYSADYTLQVDNGLISEYDFVHNGPNGGGYGLAQWTFPTRKQNLYNMWESGTYFSIGDLTLACDYLYWELQNLFAGVLETLKTATSIREASDKVLHDFEAPGDQSESVEILREERGRKYFNMYYTGGEKRKRKKLPLYMMLMAVRRRV